MPWIHLEFETEEVEGKIQFKRAVLTDDNAEEIAEATRIELERDFMEPSYSFGQEGPVKMVHSALPSGRFSIEFFSRNMQRLQEALWPDTN